MDSDFSTLRRPADFAGMPFVVADTGTRKAETTVTTGLPENTRAAFPRALAPQYVFCRTRPGGEVPKFWQG